MVNAEASERTKGGGRPGAGALTPQPVGTDPPALLERRRKGHSSQGTLTKRGNLPARRHPQLEW